MVTEILPVLIVVEVVFRVSIFKEMREEPSDGEKVYEVTVNQVDNFCVTYEEEGNYVL